VRKIESVSSYDEIKLFRSIPELDQNLFSTNFHVENEHEARSLLALSEDQSIPKTKNDWIEKLNEIYCQSISLECEHIEVI
jgi:2-oxoglutarate dehydrogenase complex dehydrogenase (E1) component-like enzyme